MSGTQGRRSAMDRRQWLRTTSLAAGAGLALGRTAFAAVPPGGSAEAPPDAPTPRPLATPIKLDQNENPYGISPKARAAITASFDESPRYRSSAYAELAKLVAEQAGVPADHVLVASGSGEVLCLAGMAYGLAGGEIVAASPTYHQLTGYAQTVGAYIHRVPVDAGMQHELEAMERRITHAVRLVFVCNPNNPTGTVLPADRLRAFCEGVSRRAVVFVDEAYHEYVDDPAYASMVSLVRAGHNVIVSRTASKIHGMAGLRIGFAIARPDLIARLQQYGMGFPNVLAARAAIASYRDPEHQAFSRAKNREARSYLYALFDELGRRYTASQGNFVFFHTGRPIQEFQAAMQAKGVLVGRPFPPFLEWCRVSTGTMDEMKRFGAALRDVTA